MRFTPEGLYHLGTWPVVDADLLPPADDDVLLLRGLLPVTPLLVVAADALAVWLDTPGLCDKSVDSCLLAGKLAETNAVMTGENTTGS